MKSICKWNIGLAIWEKIVYNQLRTNVLSSEGNRWRIEIITWFARCFRGRKIFLLQVKHHQGTSSRSGIDQIIEALKDKRYEVRKVFYMLSCV